MAPDFLAPAIGSCKCLRSFCGRIAPQTTLMNSKKLIGLGIALAAFTGNFVRAHEGHDHGKEENKGEQSTIVLPQAVENKGPVKIQTEKTEKTSGAGYWTFAPAKELVPLPEEAKPHVKGAHGTVLVDPSNGTL